MLEMIIQHIRRIASNLTGNSTERVCPHTARERQQKRLAKRRSKLLDEAIKADWKNEEKRIKLLLLGRVLSSIFVSRLLYIYVHSSIYCLLRIASMLCLNRPHRSNILMYSRKLFSYIDRQEFLYDIHH